MDKIKAFVESMTFWNWLALIAFIFLPLSALNAFFSLKSRYRDWRGAQTRKGFEERLTHLEKEWLIIEVYKKDLAEYFLYLTERLLRPIMMMFLLMVLFIALSPRVPGIAGTTFELAALRLTFIVAALIPVADVMRLTASVRRMRYPQAFGKEMIDFAANAKSNGFESDAAKQLISRMVTSNIFSDSQRDSLKTYLIKQYSEGVKLLLDV
jgi:hypothetical protein